MISSHKATKHVYPGNQGKAPLGPYKFMGILHAQMILELEDKDPTTLFIADRASTDRAHDFLAFYSQRFNAIGLANGVPGRLVLRHMLNGAMGLAGPESGWAPGCGVDLNNKTSQREPNGAEAGPYQTSYDSHTASAILVKLFTKYRAICDENPKYGWLDVWSEGCRHITIHNLGGEPTAAFQNLSKICPVFATKYAMALMRLRGGGGADHHYGTIFRGLVGLNPYFDDMLLKVEAIVDANPNAFRAVFGLPVPAVSVKPPVPSNPTLPVIPVTPTKVNSVTDTDTNQSSPSAPVPLNDPLGDALEAFIVNAATRRSATLGAIVKAAIDIDRSLLTGGGTASSPLSLPNLEALIQPALESLVTKALAALKTPTT